MKQKSRKLPIGIQDFEQIRTEGYLLVDKTEYLYKLVHTGKPYFLSRPRRFGKSLFLSMLKAYWEGKRELFRGLRMEEMEEDNPDAWQAYPVFYFDFNKADYRNTNVLEEVLEDHLKDWEAIYGDQYKASPLGVRFGRLMEQAVKITGKRCVVLVDEYDKPLLETMDDRDRMEHNKAVFKGFFSALKSYDACLQFVFITGVTKFSKVSIFSDLNQLRDISMTRDYAEICGITEQEMKAAFEPEIAALAEEQDLSREECLAKLKETYDGYRFHEKGSGVYNPYSLLTAFADREFGSYWFATGTPSFLVRRLREICFDPRSFTNGMLLAGKRSLMDYRDDDIDPIPLLYQTGYLTIADYDARGQVCTLAFPNEEVKYGFLESLLPAYVEDVGAGSGKDVLSLRRFVEAGDLEGIRKVFTALFASIPYFAHEAPFEHDFQAVFYITLTLLGQFVHCEMHTYTGRIDCVLETDQFVYLFEFKRDGTAEEALKRIEEMRYAEPFAADQRELFKIGVSFDSKERRLDGWLVR